MTAPEPDPGQVAALAERLAEGGGRRLRGPVLRVLHLPTGGCGGCAGELDLLLLPHHALERAGVRLVDTPRLADALLVSGAVTRNLAGVLARAWAAMGQPRFLVALGDCAAGADPGPGAGAAYALAPGGLRAALPIDLAIRGSPPTPEAIRYGLATLRAAALS